MAFIYNLTDSWTDAATTWNGIKLAVTNTASSASSNLLNLTVTGATTASFVVDKSGNLALNGTVNKVTITAPATAATLTLANNSTFITSGAYSSTFTFTGTTTLTFPTSGTVTALGNTTTGSGSIVLATSPTLVTPALGTPTALTLTNATGLPISTGLTGTGSGVLTALAVNVGSAGAFVTFNGALGTPSSGNLSNCVGYPSGSLSGLGTGVATALSKNVGDAGAIVVQNGVLGTPSSGTLTNATGLPLTTGVTGTLPVANGGTGITSFGTGVATALGVNVGSAGAFVVNGGALGTPSSGTLTNATGLPISTGVSGLGTGVATFLATPSSANLASAVTDETGSGPLVFATSPTFTSQITLGTQSTTRGTLVLANTTAGSKAVTLQSSNSTAAAYTLTLPAAAPVNGYYLQTDSFGQLSWAAGGGGGGGSPGGSNTQVQYNNAGAFGGSPGFTFDGTATVALGVASTTSGVFNLYNSLSANAVSVKSGNNASAWSFTLPTGPGTNGYALTTDGTGVTTWTSIQSGLAVGTTAITGGTSGRILYDNAGVLGEYSVIPVSLGGTNATSASITAFNNITGYTATGATGTTSTNLVFSTSPTITTPTISGNETHTGTGALFLADFSNATVTSRFAFQTSTTNGSTGIYALPNGTSTAASWQATNNATATNCSKILIATNGSTDVQLVSGINGTGTYLPLSFYTSGAQKMVLDTSGNLGVGQSSPSTYADSFGPVVVAGASVNWATIQGRTDGPSGAGNGVSYGGSYSTNPINGARIFLAASGSAGQQGQILFYTKNLDDNTTQPTERMRLDNAGNLGLGVTPSAWSGGPAYEITGGAFWSNANSIIYTTQNTYFNGTNWIYKTTQAASYVRQYLGTWAWFNAPSGTAGTAATFTQAMTLDASGNLGIGTASPAAKLDVYGGSGAVTTTIRAATGQNAFLSVMGNGNAFLSTSFDIIQDSTNAAQIFQRANAPLLFGTNNVERARLDSVGNLLIGGSAARGTTAGSAHLDLFNGTAPAGTLTNGISLYSSSGDFNFMDSSGNGYKVGFRNIPQNAQTSAYALAIGDVGKHISITTGGVTVNSGIFSAGDVVTIFNNSGSGQTITQGTSVTMYLAGTATTGNRTLAQRGVCTVLCVASNTFVISGAGLT